MAAPAGRRGRLKVAVMVGDRGLAGRIAGALAAYPDLAPAAGTEAADIVVAAAEELGELPRASAAALVVLGSGAVDGGGALPRALLPAGTEPDLIASVIRLVARGLVVLPEAVIDGGAAEAGGDDEAAAPPEAAIGFALTPREREVLELLAAGASNKVIARQLGVSVHTAKFHVASLFRKLGASGRLDAVGIGLRAGLLMM